MFDNFTDPSHERKRGRAAVLLTGSIVVHAGIVAGLLLSSAWRIAKLPVAEDRLVFVGSLGPPGGNPPPLGSPKAPLHKPSPKPKVPKVVRTDAYAANRAELTEVDSDGGDTGSDTGHGVSWGVPDGTGDPNQPPGIGGCLTPPCGTGSLRVTDEERKAIEQDEPPINVPAFELERISGNVDIKPSDATRSAMNATGRTEFVATIKLCVNARGAVTSVHLLKSSGYADYDAAIRGEVARWRYRPYHKGNQPVAVCAPVRFVYRLK